MSTTYLKVYLQTPSKVINIIMELLWKRMACSLSLTFNFSILHELDSKIIFRPPFQNDQKCGNFLNVGKDDSGSPTLSTIVCG